MGYGRSKVRVGQGALAYAVAYGLAGLLGYAFTVGVSRRLGYDDLGAYSVGIALTIAVALVCRWGLDVAAVHHIAAARAKDDAAQAARIAATAFAVSGGAGIAGALVLWLVAPAIAPLFDARLDVEVIRVLALCVPFYNVVYVGASVLRGAGRATPAFVPLLVVPLASVLLAGVMLLVLDAGLVAVCWATVVAYAGAAAIAWGLGRRELGSAKGWSVPGPFLATARSNFLVQLANYGIVWTGLLVLGIQGTSSDAGYFRVAFQTSMLLSLVVDGISSLYAPISSRLFHERDMHHLEELTKSSGRVAFIITGTASLALVIAPGPALAPFGANVGPATIPFVVLVLAHAASSAFGPSGWLLVTGEHRTAAYMTVVPAFLLGLLAAWFLVPAWGIVGAAVASALAIVVRTLLIYAFVRSLVGIDVLSRPLARGLAAYSAILVAAVAFAIFVPGVALVVAGAAAALFLVVSLAFVLTPDDRKAAIALVRASRSLATAKGPKEAPHDADLLA